VGWSPDDPALSTVRTLAELEPLLDPDYVVEGCHLLPAEEAERRVGAANVVYTSRSNGRGPLAWRNHWLYVLLRDRTGAVTGVIWADEPGDRLVPTRERLRRCACSRIRRRRRSCRRSSSRSFASSPTTTR
jgi:hypothetical protein